MDDTRRTRFKNVIFRTIRRGGRTMVIPMQAAQTQASAAYNTAGKARRGLSSFVQGQKESLIQSIASYDPSRAASKVAEYAGVAVDSVAKHAIDQAVEKAEDRIAKKVDVMERAVRKALTRQIATAQTHVTGRTPNIRVDFEEKARQRYPSGRLKLRSGFSINQIKKDLNDLAKTFRNAGIDIESPSGRMIYLETAQGMLTRNALTENERLRTQALHFERQKSAIDRLTRQHQTRAGYRAPYDID